jgi:N-acetyl-anhydromuramoyl-L-alanine amidase
METSNKSSFHKITPCKLRLDKQGELLQPVQFLNSPHQDARPANTILDLIVVHGISLPPGEFGSNAIEKLFLAELNTLDHPSFASIATLKVSAHVLIKRCGNIIQFVPFSKRAWHAGVSYFEGRTHCNDFSIGIELEGVDHLPYELEQYKQLAMIIKLLQQHYPAITSNRIVGHSDVAPGRKTDPGPAFDWSYLRKLL